MEEWVTQVRDVITQWTFWRFISSTGLKWLDLFDILIMTFIVYQLMMLTRDTRANQVLKGFGVLLVASFIASLTNLKAVTWLLKFLLEQGAIVLVVLFQPELRRALEQIGRGSLLEKGILPHDDSVDVNRLIEEITRALLNMSKRKVGALIVIERRTGLNDILETGTPIDAEISAALIENIFEPNTPLHDGATVLRGNRVAAAGCFLQLTEDLELSRELGTRHRAALGITETTDAVSLIVSEESGIISVAQQGKLTRYLDARALKELLGGIYLHNREQQGLIGSLKKRRGSRHE